MNNLQENGLFNDKKRKKRENKKKRRNFGQIIFYLSLLAEKISAAIKNSFFGYVFTDLYARLNDAWTGGYLYRRFRKWQGLGSSTLRGGLARLYEDSFICKLVTRISRRILQSHLRLWGSALFSFAFVSVFVSMIGYYFTSVLDSENVAVSIAFALISVPMLASKKRFGEALLGGRLSYYVINHILSLDESKLCADPSCSGGSYPAVLSLSALLGFLTYFFSPLALIEIVLLLLLFVVIMCFPELGVISVLTMIPFSSIFERPSAAIFVLVVFSLLGFVSKFIRGKRVLSFELMDVLVMVFGGLMLFGGVFSRGGVASALSAIMYFTFILMYFLIVNAFIRKTWIYRGIRLVVLSTSVVALIGIFEDGVISSSYVDMSVFSDIGARVSSLLGNPNMLGVYLVIVFPLCLAQMLTAKRGTGKFLYGLCSLAILICTVMTWSRGAWLGMIASVLVFAIIYNFKTIWVFAAGLFTMPLWIELLPRSILNRLLSIVTMSDSSVIYRFNTWRGVLDMIRDNLFTGVGVGESAFKQVYSMYAVPGTETVMHSHNLFLQITLELGIVGIAVLCLIILSYTQKSLGAIKDGKKNGKSRAFIAATFSGTVGALVMGLTDHIWYNYRVFLIFWAVMALGTALVKINCKEKAKEDAANENNSARAEIDIRP